MSHFPVPKIDESGVSKVKVSDFSTRDVLDQILGELKKMNVHLESITDENIEAEDLL